MASFQAKENILIIENMQEIVDGLKKVVCSNEISQKTVQAALKSVIQQRCAFRAQCILRVNK